MTFLQAIQNAIRAYVLNSTVASVVHDLATNGLSTADKAIVDAYLATTMP